MNLKKLEEIAKEKGKVLLIENRILHIPKESIEVFTDSKLIESNGEQIKCRGILRNVPITTFTENDNGRIYNRKLWENVQRIKIFEGSDCLTNHPEDEGDVNDTCGIWADFRINEETGNADLCCVGDKGALMLEILQVKGKVGFSTVGYGEFMEDGKTVNPETYEYERTDWVRDPSQRTFATHANLVTEDKEIVEKVEKSNKKEELLKEMITNNKVIINKNDEKNNIDEVERMERFNEANFKNQVIAIIREAKKNPNVIEGIEILKSVDVNGDEKLEEKVESAVFELQEKIDNEKKEMEGALSDSTEKLDELQTKYDTATEALETLKENYNKAKAIIEKVGIAEDQEDVEDIIKEKEKMTEDVKQFTENVEIMEADINQLVEDRKTMKSDIKQLIEDRKTMKGDIKKFSEKYKTLGEKYKALNEKYKALVKEQDEMEYEDNDEVEPFIFESDVDGGVEPAEVPENDIEAEGGASLYNEPSLEQDITDDELLDNPQNTEPIPADEIAEEDEMEYEIDDEEEIIAEEDEMEYEDEEEEIIEEDDEEEFDFVRDVVNADEKEEVVESKVNVMKEEIKKLYIQEAKKFPAIKDIKKIIFSSDSVVDALNKITKFKESKKSKNKPVKISEKTVKRPDWLPKNRY